MTEQFLSALGSCPSHHHDLRFGLKDYQQNEFVDAVKNFEK